MNYLEIARETADFIINKATGKNGLVCESINCLTGEIVSAKSNVSDLGDYVQHIIWLGKILGEDRYTEWGKNQVMLAEKYCKQGSGLYNGSINVNDVNARKNRINVYYTNNTDLLIGLVAAGELTKDAKIIGLAKDYIDAIFNNAVVDDSIVMMIMPALKYKLPISEPMTSGNFIEELINLYRITNDVSYLNRAEKLAKPWIDFDYFKDHKLFARRPLNIQGRIINIVHDRARMITNELNMSDKILSYSRPMIAKQNTHLIFGLLRLYKLTGNEVYKKTVLTWTDNIMDKMKTADNKFYSYYNIITNRPSKVSLIENHSMIELLIDMHLTFKEQRFLDIAVNCARSWVKESIDGLIPRTPGMNIAELDPEIDFCVDLIKLWKLTNNDEFLNNAENILNAVQKHHKTEHGYCYSIDMIDKTRLGNVINAKNIALTLKPFLLMAENEKLFKDECIMQLVRDR